MAEEQPSQAASDHSCQNPPQHTNPKQIQVPAFGGFTSPNGDFQTFPVTYPVLVPGLSPLQQDLEQINRGPGLYAVPVHPFTGPVTGFPPNMLIPFTYNVPTARSSSETTAADEDQGQVGQQQPQQQQLPAPQRHVVVRRFQIAFHIDLLLILKLAAVVFLFNQDGSRERLALLVFFAAVIYLYQTGALAPLVRWLSQGMQRAAAPPRPPRPAVQGDIDPAGGRQGNEDAAGADGQPRGEHQNQPVDDENREVGNEQVVEPGGVQGGNRWWGIVKEIQLIVFGFITSLLPGFHNID